MQTLKIVKAGEMLTAGGVMVEAEGARKFMEEALG